RIRSRAPRRRAPRPRARSRAAAGLGGGRECGRDFRACAAVLRVSLECARRMRNHSTASPAAVASPAAPLIDIGINLAHDSYDADREAAPARAEPAGAVPTLTTGSTLPRPRPARALRRPPPLTPL